MAWRDMLGNGRLEEEGTTLPVEGSLCAQSSPGSFPVFYQLGA